MHPPKINDQTTIQCAKCGKFIAYKDLKDNAILYFIPDNAFTPEKVEWVHIKC